MTFKKNKVLNSCLSVATYNKSFSDFSFIFNQMSIMSRMAEANCKTKTDFS